MQTAAVSPSTACWRLPPSCSRAGTAGWHAESPRGAVEAKKQEWTWCLRLSREPGRRMAHLGSQQQPADCSGARAGPRRQRHQLWVHVLGPKNPRCRRPPAMRHRLQPPGRCPLAGLASAAPDSGGRTSRDESECRCRRALCGRISACGGDMQGSSRASGRLCWFALPGRPSPEAHQRPEIRTWGRDASEMGATVLESWPN